MLEPRDETCRVEPVVRGSRRAWLQMLRPPNLFTVPGDPLAGYLLASAAIGSATPVDVWRPALVAVASLLLYAGGLLQNDYFDLAEDRRQRPSRPLPSGRANPRSAAVAGFAAASAGVLAAVVASPASGLASAILMAVMTAYNAGCKRVRIVGPLLMGGCRGLSLLAGAALLGIGALRQPPVALSATGLLVLVAAITRIASRETETVWLGPRRWLPAIVLTIWLAFLSVSASLPHPWDRWIAFSLAAWAIIWMVYCGCLLAGRPAPSVVQRTIGRFIGGLLFVQAALAAHVPSPGLMIAAGLLVAWPASRRIGKWYDAS